MEWMHSRHSAVTGIVSALHSDNGLHSKWETIMMNNLLGVYDFSSDRQQGSSSRVVWTVSKETSGWDATRTWRRKNHTFNKGLKFSQSSDVHIHDFNGLNDSCILKTSIKKRCQSHTHERRFRASCGTKRRRHKANAKGPRRSCKARQGNEKEKRPSYNNVLWQRLRQSAPGDQGSEAVQGKMSCERVLGRLNVTNIWQAREGQGVFFCLETFGGREHQRDCLVTMRTKHSHPFLCYTKAFTIHKKLRKDASHRSLLISCCSSPQQNMPWTLRNTCRDLMLIKDQGLRVWFSRMMQKAACEALPPHGCSQQTRFWHFYSNSIMCSDTRRRTICTEVHCSVCRCTLTMVPFFNSTFHMSMVTWMVLLAQ